MVFEEKWDNLIAPTIVKKYTDMRCNVNGFVRNIYLSEYLIQYYLIINRELVARQHTNHDIHCVGEEDKIDGRNLFVPEELSLGVTHFKDAGRLDELMEFLAGYVRVVHANRYYKSLLIKNRGSSYLDIITASDVAYIVSLINNSDCVWLDMKTPDGELVKPRYSSGKGLKHVYGVTTWNQSGMKYYHEVMKTWKEAFTTNAPAFKILHRHCDKWIEDKDGGRKFMLNDGNAKKKSAYSLLATRSEGEVLCAASDDDDEDDEDDHEEFDYESDPDENNIILSNWTRKRGGRGVGNGYNDSDDEDIGSDSEAGSGDGEDVGVGNGIRDSIRDNSGMDNHDEDDVEDSDDDDDDDEEEGAGMENARNNNKRKRSVQPSVSTEDIRRSSRRVRGTWS
jgi:hypothetical protein